MVRTATSLRDRRLAELGFDTYDEYLNSGFWLDTRMRYKEAGLPQECAICGRADYQLHHRDYGALGEEPLEHLVALCEDHHYEVHKMVSKGYPGVTLWNVHIVYKDQWEERRRRRMPRRFGEVDPHLAITLDERMLLAADRAERD